LRLLKNALLRSQTSGARWRFNTRPSSRFAADNLQTSIAFSRAVDFDATLHRHVPDSDARHHRARQCE
jgi:hypothetical protein